MKRNSFLLTLAVCLFSVLIVLLVGNGPAEQAMQPSELTTQRQTEPETTAQTVTVPPSSTQTAPAEPLDTDFVRIRDFIPDIVVDLKYASDDNFTGTVIYSFTEPWLRYGTVKKLLSVQDTLRQQGLSLKIWDAYRPVEAQFKLWDVCPDPNYVADPNRGFSSHSRGNTVDITLVDFYGVELEMPTGFDDFSTLADRDYSDCGQETADHALLLERVMEAWGFHGYAGEWWHFSDTVSYDVEMEFAP